MAVYLDIAILLNLVVDWLLLMGANRLMGYPFGIKRTLLAAGFGSIYAGMCLLPGFHFLGNLLWRTISLGIMGMIAYGYHRSALRRGGIFALLSMALGGLVMGLGNNDLLTLVYAGMFILILCFICVRSPLGIEKFMPVELSWGGHRLKLTALVDTGDLLSDPITGNAVTVVGEEVGRQLGISREMIHDPIANLTKSGIPGARLIPYHSVGKTGGMLLLLRLEEVKLNGRVISPMVAFAPEELGRTEGYQALAGGIL